MNKTRITLTLFLAGATCANAGIALAAIKHLPPGETMHEKHHLHYPHPLHMKHHLHNPNPRHDYGETFIPRLRSNTKATDSTLGVQ